MTSVLLIGMAVFLSWLLGLSFIKANKVAVFIDAGISAVLSIIAFWLIRLADFSFILPPVFFGLYLAESFAIQLQNRLHYGNTFLSFCISFSAFTVFIPLSQIANSLKIIPILIVSSIFFFCFLFAFLLLYKRFPGRDWQEYFTSGMQDQNQLNIRQIHIYSVAGLLCVINTVFLTVKCETLWHTVAVCSGMFLLLWSSVLLIIVMAYYKKERLAVLLEKQYREEAQAFMNVIRSQRHDYNFHVQTIAGLMAGNKIEECRAYVNVLEKDSAEMNVLMPIKDPAISATIFSFHTLAIREGINLHIDIEYDLSQIATNVYETNKILSNLLQNAIDEVTTLTDKSYGIWLTILKRGEFCVIRVSNKVKNPPLAEHLGKIYDQGYTTKSGHEGVGLSSIRLLAGRYRGIVYAQTEDDILHFIARIPINTVKEEEY